MLGNHNSCPDMAILTKFQLDMRDLIFTPGYSLATYDRIMKLESYSSNLS